MNSEINLVSGDINIVDDIQELWEELNQLHLEKSQDHKQHYMSFKFQERKDTLIEYAEKGKLLIFIAYHKDIKIGYCVASIVDDIGEIDSIYIKSNYRRIHVGNMLMEASLNWIKSYNSKKIIVQVSTGNEEVFGFYSKYGFAPRLTELQLVQPFNK